LLSQGASVDIGICVPAYQTSIDVSYALTGLSDEGNAIIESYVGDAYVTMIEGWRGKILADLKRSPHRVLGPGA
jgi:hypothetical protein